MSRLTGRAPLAVLVEHAVDPIDLRAWAELYVREVLKLEGIEVLGVISAESPTFLQAG